MAGHSSRSAPTSGTRDFAVQYTSLVLILLTVVIGTSAAPPAPAPAPPPGAVRDRDAADPRLPAPPPTPAAVPLGRPLTIRAFLPGTTAVDAAALAPTAEVLANHDVGVVAEVRFGPGADAFGIGRAAELARHLSELPGVPAGAVTVRAVEDRDVPAGDARIDDASTDSASIRFVRDASGADRR